MVIHPKPENQASLAVTDETAWLEETAALLFARRFDQVDPETLADYLSDMARRDRREVASRLVILLTHLLKWEYQPDHRSRSWRATILEQQRELKGLLESETLRNHAFAVFSNSYEEARKQAAAETGLAGASFPGVCSWDLDASLADQGEVV